MPDSTTQQIQMDHMTEGWRQNQRESFTWSGGKQKGRHMPVRSVCISPTSCNTSLSAQSLTPWLDIRDKNNNAQSHMSSNLCPAQKAGFIHNLIGRHHFCPYWKALHLFEFKFLLLSLQNRHEMIWKVDDCWYYWYSLNFKIRSQTVQESFMWAYSQWSHFSINLLIKIHHNQLNQVK